MAEIDRNSVAFQFWFNDLKKLAREKHYAFVNDFDEAAWRVFFEAGYSPEKALEEDLNVE